MTQAFLDTSYLIALAVSNDAHHARPLALRERLKHDQTLLVTNSAIILEIGDGLARLRHRRIAISILDFLRNDPSLEVIQLSSHLVEDALALYRQRPDKEWGLTDCVSFVVMRERGITDALTADEHFQQAGFRALMRDA